MGTHFKCCSFTEERQNSHNTVRIFASYVNSSPFSVIASLLNLQGMTLVRKLWKTCNDSITRNDGSASRRETSPVLGNITGLGTKVEFRDAKKEPIGRSH